MFGGVTATWLEDRPFACGLLVRYTGNGARLKFHGLVRGPFWSTDAPRPEILGDMDDDKPLLAAATRS